MTDIDQEEDIFHSPFYATLPRGARVSRSPRRSKKEIVVPPILKFDGSVKGSTVINLLVVDSQQGHSEEHREEEHLAEEREQCMDEGSVIQATDVPEPRMEEGAIASEKSEPSKGSPIGGLVDAPSSDPPPTEPTAGPAELIVKEEAFTSKEGEPRKESLVDGPVDNPLGNPPPAEPVAEPE